MTFPFPKLYDLDTGAPVGRLDRETVTAPCGRCSDAGPLHLSGQCWATYKQGTAYGGLLCRCPGWVPA